MKWFKHDSFARVDPKITKLRMRYGVEGYGLYFYCLEVIASEVSSSKFSFELEQDSEIIAHELRMDSRRVEEILSWCVNSGLFEITGTGVMTCWKMIKRLDESTTKNSQVREIISKGLQIMPKNGSIRKNSGMVPEKFGGPTNSSVQTRLDKTTKDYGNPAAAGFPPPVGDNGPKKSKRADNKDHIQIFDYWNTKDIKNHRSLSAKQRTKITQRLKEYPKEEIISAIDNYSTILNGEKYFWNHRWRLEDFLQRGLERFLNESNPLKDYVKAEMRFPDSNEEEDSAIEQTLEQMR